MNRMPLLDGRTVDLDDGLDGHPAVQAKRTIVLDAREWWVGSEHPPWLSYNTDNGPGSATFNGLSGAGKGGVTLSTGTASTGDTTYLEGPTIDYSNWRSVRIYARMAVSDLNAIGYLILADASDADSATEGWIHSQPDWRTNTNGLYYVIEHNDSTVYNYDQQSLDATVQQSHGFHIRQGDGESEYFHNHVINGAPSGSYYEGQGSYVDATDLTLRAGVRTTDTGADRSVTIEGLWIELTPK